MPTVIRPKTPIDVSDLRIGIRSLTVRTADGVRDRMSTGEVKDPGVVSMSLTPGNWAGAMYISDGRTLELEDAQAWIQNLDTMQNPLTAEAAARFQRAQDDLLWLSQLALSLQSAPVCDAPAATPVPPPPTQP